MLVEARGFIDERRALLKQRFKLVLEAVLKLIKPVIPEWRECVIAKEDKEKIVSTLLAGKITGIIGDAYTLGKAVQAEVEILNLS